MADSKTSGKLQGKDLITVGIYTAIYLVITIVISRLNYIPIFMILLAILVPLIGSTPYMLFLTKVKKFGMVLIMSTIMGIIMFLTGMGYWSILTGVIAGLLAELAIKSGGYSSAGKSVLSSGLFSLWVFGNFIPMVVTRESYYENLVSLYSQEYADKLLGYMPAWMLPILLIACFVSGIIGGLIGKALTRKHFQRAGIN